MVQTIQHCLAASITIQFEGFASIPSIMKSSPNLLMLSYFKLILSAIFSRHNCHFFYPNEKIVTKVLNSLCEVLACSCYFLGFQYFVPIVPHVIHEEIWILMSQGDKFMLESKSDTSSSNWPPVTMVKQSNSRNFL